MLEKRQRHHSCLRVRETTGEHIWNCIAKYWMQYNTGRSYPFLFAFRGFRTHFHTVLRPNSVIKIPWTALAFIFFCVCSVLSVECAFSCLFKRNQIEMKHVHRTEISNNMPESRKQIQSFLYTQLSSQSGRRVSCCMSYANDILTVFFFLLLYNANGDHQPYVMVSHRHKYFGLIGAMSLFHH